MLADIADSLNSGKYGTFLGNSEQEYVQLKDRTRSLRDALTKDEKCLNAKYDPALSSASVNSLLQDSKSPSSQSFCIFSSVGIMLQHY
jgi:hypothetical protein